jgi:hypothetical protein
MMVSNGSVPASAGAAGGLGVLVDAGVGVAAVIPGMESMQGSLEREVPEPSQPGVPDWY